MNAEKNGDYPLKSEGNSSSSEASQNAESTSEFSKLSIRKDWWQKAVVRRSLPSIERNFIGVVGDSQFLQVHMGDDRCTKRIAIFHRSEIVTGSQLGQGGFSVVLEIVKFQLRPDISSRCSPAEQALREEYASAALNTSGDSRFCIKYLQEGLLKQPKDFEVAASDLVVESAYMSALDHPNIAVVYGLPVDGLQAWGQDGKYDGYFIITERLTPLDSKITSWKDKKDQSVSEKMEYAWQLAEALGYLHLHRIVFRDLKPQNIGFSTVDNRVQLFDFGLCRELPQTDTLEGTYKMSGVGTRRYTAPEIITDGCYNTKADIYSWSLVAWEMLTLCKPYALLSTQQHDLQVCCGGQREFLSQDWPGWVQTLLQQSWNTSLNDRWTMHKICQVFQSNLRPNDFGELGRVLAKESQCQPYSPTSVQDIHMESITQNGSKRALVSLAPLQFDVKSSSVNVCPHEECRVTGESVDLESIDNFPEQSTDTATTTITKPTPTKPKPYSHLPNMVRCNICLLEDDISTMM